MQGENVLHRILELLQSRSNLRTKFSVKPSSFIPVFLEKALTFLTEYHSKVYGTSSKFLVVKLLLSSVWSTQLQSTKESYFRCTHMTVLTNQTTVAACRPHFRKLIEMHFTIYFEEHFSSGLHFNPLWLVLYYWPFIPGTPCKPGTLCMTSTSRPLILY